MGKKTPRTLRFDKNQWGVIEELKRLSGPAKRTNQEIFDCILAWLEGLSEDAKLAVAMNGNGNRKGGGLDHIWDVIHLMSWGDHAFRLVEKSASWSIQEYQRLKSLAKEKDAPGMFDFACYRLAYCWLCMARQLRNEAFTTISIASNKVSIDEENWRELFTAADRAIQYAIAHNELVLSSRIHPVLYFNLSCDYSRRAQFLFESRLPEISKAKLKALHKDPNSRTAVSKLFSALPKTGDAFAGISPQIDEYLDKSLENLRESIRTDDEWVEMSFLVEFADLDDDLAALREYPTKSAQFQSWQENLKEPSPLRVMQKLERQVEDDAKATMNST